MLGATKRYDCQFRIYVVVIMSKCADNAKSSRWTKEEEATLFKLHTDGFNASDIAERLNRSKISIQQKIFKLNISRPIYWSEIEIQILKKNYYDTTKEELLKLIPNRTFESIKTKAKTLGLKRINKGNSSWTNKEIKLLEKLYNDDVIYKDIANNLNKSKQAIVQKLGDLKIRQKQPRCNWWTEEEVQLLKKSYKYYSITKLNDMFERHSKHSIKVKARELKLVGHKIKNRIWEDKECLLLIEFHNNGFSLEEMAEKLDRDINAVRLKSKPIRGNYLFWKQEELDILRSSYSFIPQKDLEKLLPNKSWVSICHKSRSLGLSRPLKLLWKQNELELLVQNYPTMTVRELVGILPQKSKNQIINKAKILGLRKNKRTLAKCLRLKHDIDLENISFSHEKMNSWRKKVLKRDECACQECGIVDKTGQDLHAHHIIPKRDCDENKKCDISNGITLCIECHKKTINKEYKYANKYLSLVVK